jgi:acyl-CoA synthetase (AMP-forming)/AMP-acid ligase II
MAKFNIPHFRTRSPPPSNAAIKTVADLIEFNADKNPHHLFCIQMQSGSSPPLRITNKLLRDTISTCQEWVLKTVREAKQTITNDAGEAIKGSPVAIMMDSNFDLLVHLFSLIGLGIPVSSRNEESSSFANLSRSCFFHLDLSQVHCTDF